MEPTLLSSTQNASSSSNGATSLFLRSGVASSLPIISLSFSMQSNVHETDVRQQDDQQHELYRTRSQEKVLPIGAVKFSTINKQIIRQIQIEIDDNYPCTYISAYFFIFVT